MLLMIQRVVLVPTNIGISPISFGEGEPSRVASVSLGERESSRVPSGAVGTLLAHRSLNGSSGRRGTWLGVDVPLSSNGKHRGVILVTHPAADALAAATAALPHRWVFPLMSKRDLVTAASIRHNDSPIKADNRSWETFPDKAAVFSKWIREINSDTLSTRQNHGALSWEIQHVVDFPTSY